MIQLSLLPGSVVIRRGVNGWYVAVVGEEVVHEHVYQDPKETSVPPADHRRMAAATSFADLLEDVFGGDVFQHDKEAGIVVEVKMAGRDAEGASWEGEGERP